MVGKKASIYTDHRDTQDAEEYRIAKYTVVVLDYTPRCPTCKTPTAFDWQAFCSNCGQALLYHPRKVEAKLRTAMRKHKVQYSDELPIEVLQSITQKK